MNHIYSSNKDLLNENTSVKVHSTDCEKLFDFPNEIIIPAGKNIFIYTHVCVRIQLFNSYKERMLFNL